MRLTHPVNTIVSRPSGYEAMRWSEVIGFQDRKKQDNVEKEKAHLLSLGVPFSFARKVSVHVTLYDKKTEEYPFPGTLGQSEGCLTNLKTALNWGC